MVALLDPDSSLWGQAFLGVPVLGGDGLLPELLRDRADGVFLGVGSLGDVRLRVRLFEQHRDHLVEVRHPSAVLAPSVKYGQGLIALARVVVNPLARLGDNVILNTGCIVEHDCVVDDHAHISPGAILCGDVRVGWGSHVGAGAVVRQGITVGREVLVGAGAVVVRDVPDGARVAGVPARLL